MSDSLDRGRWRRIGRLASLLPRLARQLGCRRRDFELRERVESVPPGTAPEVIERRKEMARCSACADLGIPPEQEAGVHRRLANPREEVR